MGIDAFTRNGLEIDWDILIQGEECTYLENTTCNPPA